MLHLIIHKAEHFETLSSIGKHGTLWGVDWSLSIQVWNLLSRSHLRSKPRLPGAVPFPVTVLPRRGTWTWQSHHTSREAPTCAS